MTTHQLTDSSAARTTDSAAPVPAGRSILRRLWQAVLDVAHGVDAGALVAHGRPVPPDHPARRRLDHEEVANRLDELYPRA
ncbi:hypothetical protein HNR19_000082 [Nocardioides thalensis]|uniref:Uncharacterized protein n=1 Tax=Nocardioides thalensis TaxID=1914755 RepID=A0A853BWD1_9ACTN|nr:hypothetical protein [Nocardioides thalensis]NYI99383.1 hypothetical protein [Nocardioides thalensis]